MINSPNDLCGESTLLLESPSTSLRVNDFGDPSWPQNRNLNPSGSIRAGDFLYAILSIWLGKFYSSKQQEVILL